MKLEKKSESKLLQGWFLPIAGALVSSIAFSYYLGFSTKDPFTFFFLAGFLFLFKLRMGVKDKTDNIVSAVVSVIFTAFMLLNKVPEIYESVGDTVTGDKYISLIVGFFAFFFAVFGLIFDKIRSFDITSDNQAMPFRKQAAVFIGITLLLFLFWLPFFILRFPGELTDDSLNQLLIVTGVYPKSNHHPYAHTMTIKLLYELGLKMFGNKPEYGIAVYSIVQMFFMAMAYAYFITAAFRFRVKKWFIVASMFFYMFPGYNILYSFTMWKDIPFSGFVLVYSTALWRYLLKNDKENKLPELIVMLFSGMGVCLFRSNGLYAFVVMALFIVGYSIKKKNLKLSGVTAAALAISLIVHGPVYSALGVAPPDPIESLSIPAQQIAAVISAGKQLSEEDEKLLGYVADVDRIPECYDKTVSDPIKELVRETGDQTHLISDKKQYLDLWLKLGGQYPVIYLYAYVCQTCGYWYPDHFLWIYPAQTELTESFDYMPDRENNEAAFFDDIWNSHDEMPLVGMLWSSGLFTWTTIIAAAFTLIKKKKKELMIYILPFCIIGTLLIATPAYAQFRYVYSIVLATPLYFMIPFVGTKNAAETKTG